MVKLIDLMIWVLLCVWQTMRVWWYVVLVGMMTSWMGTVQTEEHLFKHVLDYIADHGLAVNKMQVYASECSV